METNCHSKAIEKGFSFIRGEGQVLNGVWMSRFTKTSDGKGPALFVGFDPICFKFVYKEEKE
jgi:hypothetical protein